MHIRDADFPCNSLPDAPWGTNCPMSADWVDAMVLSVPSPDKIIMDVGCNKGNDLVAWMERFDPSRKFNTSAAATAGGTRKRTDG